MEPDNGSRLIIRSFPLGLAFLNGLIYFLARLDIPGIISWGSISILPFKTVLTLPPMVFFILIGSTIYHLVAWQVLRRLAVSRWIYAVVFLLPGTVEGGRFLYLSAPTVEAQTILEDMNLAPFPRSATGLKVFSWSTDFSGHVFLRFTASREDIESFLSSSPILKQAECERYSRDRMRLVQIRDDTRFERGPQNSNDYFSPNPTTPPWYTGEIRGDGRRYRFSPRKYGHWAEVIFDEERNVVYMSLSLG